jgi:cytochrome b561
MSRPRATRYQPALVALHWWIAGMIIGLLGLGFLVLANMPNTDPRKLNILVLHMAGGMGVLALMIPRLIIRLFSAHPVRATIGSPLLDRLAVLAHYSLYVLVFLMIASGWTTGYLIRGVFKPGGEHLPATFAVLPTFQVHATLAVLLAVLIAMHILAALYHQWVLKDDLFHRIWFGRRRLISTEP